MGKRRGGESATVFGMAPVTDHKELIENGYLAVELAREVRARHRRTSKPDDPERVRDLDLARNAIQEAMRPIRSEIGRAIFDPATSQAERRREKMRNVSAELQAERRKLWKLSNVNS